MKKAFTLAEALVTMAIIGIIMALSIPAVIQSVNDTRPLFKKSYNIVETIVSDLINDTALYPSGDLSAPATGSFCENFLNKMNTLGGISTACPNTGGAAATTFNGDGTPPVDSEDAVTSNSMAWYNLHPLSSFDPTADPADADTAFTGANCDGTNGTNLTNFIDSTDGCVTDDCCVRINIDVNGTEKGADTNLPQANRDIFTIYINTTGRIAVKDPDATTPPPLPHIWEEDYILKH